MKNKLLFIFALGVFVNCQGSNFERSKSNRKSPCSELTKCAEGLYTTYLFAWRQLVIAPLAQICNWDTQLQGSQYPQFNETKLTDSRGLDGYQSPIPSRPPSPREDKKKKE